MTSLEQVLLGCGRFSSAGRCKSRHDSARGAGDTLSMDCCSLPMAESLTEHGQQRHEAVHARRWTAAAPYSTDWAPTFSSMAAWVATSYVLQFRGSPAALYARLLSSTRWPRASWSAMSADCTKRTASTRQSSTTTCMRMALHHCRFCIHWHISECQVALKGMLCSVQFVSFT